ncbi:MAG TPA: 50S ribosomal protein L10 [Planctomycetaceae bacterium]|jgi:large subunit ribosomal protein L10|nr:50S ribosomal protein L10 [Planctomycetaceae bacterium]
MSRHLKQMIIEEVGARLNGVRDIVAVDASKLNGVTANKLRLAMRKKKISALTVSNKLAQQALKKAGVTALDPFLQGPTTLVWGGEDIVALSKEIAKWAKEIEPLVIKGGTTEGTTLSKETVDALSKSPGRVELIGQIVALMLSPGAQLAGALLGPGRKLASQVKKIADKEEGSEQEAAPAGA